MAGTDRRNGVLARHQSPGRAGLQAFERTVAFAADDDPALLAERAREAMEE